jgi:hypothetical protein
MVNFSGSNRRAIRRRDSMETLVDVHPKSFGTRLDDPTWKVLPAALEKYGIESDNWESYVLFICYDANVSGMNILTFFRPSNLFTILNFIQEIRRDSAVSRTTNNHFSFGIGLSGRENTRHS